MISPKELAEKISLYFHGKDHKISELVVDAFLSENHELKAEVAEHPLESGSNFVDHIGNQSVSVQLEGIISNTPMTLMGLTVYKSLKNWQEEESNDLAEKAFRELEKIFYERKPITISTSLKDYKNMVLESLSIERGPTSSSSLRFRCSAKQIRIIELNHISIPEPKVKRVKPKKPLGMQPAKELPKAESQKIAKSTTALNYLFGK